MKLRSRVLFVLFAAVIVFVTVIYTNVDAASMKLLARAESARVKGNLEKTITDLIEQATPTALSTMCAVVSESENGYPIELEPRITLKKDTVIVELYGNCRFYKNLSVPSGR